jgi:hypothetical protein
MEPIEFNNKDKPHQKRVTDLQIPSSKLVSLTKPKENSFLMSPGALQRT